MQPELTREQVREMSAAWLQEHQDELVDCRCVPGSKIRLETCQQRQRMFPIWVRVEQSGLQGGQWRVSHRFCACRSCEHFAPGKPPLRRKKGFILKGGRIRETDCAL